MLSITRNGAAPEGAEPIIKEMLAALEMVRDANRDEPHIPPTALAAIEAAIAKAKSRTE
jgi:hypothetical protein